VAGLPAKGISAYINQAVRALLYPDKDDLDAAYATARREAWRRGVAEDWKPTEVEDWPA
jgi:hypothetical protein